MLFGKIKNSLSLIYFIWGLIDWSNYESYLLEDHSKELIRVSLQKGKLVKPSFIWNDFTDAFLHYFFLIIIPTSSHEEVSLVHIPLIFCIRIKVDYFLWRLLLLLLGLLSRHWIPSWILFLNGGYWFNGLDSSMSLKIVLLVSFFLHNHSGLCRDVVSGIFSCCARLV